MHSHDNRSPVLRFCDPTQHAYTHDVVVPIESAYSWKHSVPGTFPQGASPTQRTHSELPPIHLAASLKPPRLEMRHVAWLSRPNSTNCL